MLILSLQLIRQLHTDGAENAEGFNSRINSFVKFSSTVGFQSRLGGAQSETS